VRIYRNLTLLAAALALAACGADDGDQVDDTAADDPAIEDEGDADDGDLEDDLDEELDGDLEDELGDMMDDVDDPNEDVEDGVYRGNGIVMPVPDGFMFDQMAAAQGQLIATSEDQTQNLSGQAVDVEDLPEEQQLDFEELVEGQLAQLQEEPAADDEVEVEGAERARAVLWEDLEAAQEGQPETSAVVLFADDGDGRLAVFNYAAASEDFDQDIADELTEGAGFDPDSDPAPMPEPEPAPEG
jgi:hypothetical protein